MSSLSNLCTESVKKLSFYHFSKSCLSVSLCFPFQFLIQVFCFFLVNQDPSLGLSWSLSLDISISLSRSHHFHSLYICVCLSFLSPSIYPNSFFWCFSVGYLFPVEQIFSNQWTNDEWFPLSSLHYITDDLKPAPPVTCAPNKYADPSEPNNNKSHHIQQIENWHFTLILILICPIKFCYITSYLCSLRGPKRPRSRGKARQLYLYSTFHTQGRPKVLHI